MERVPFRLYLISDRTRMGPDPVAAVATLARSGLSALQWREKDLSPADNLGWLRAIGRAVGGSSVRGAPGSGGGDSGGVPDAGGPTGDGPRFHLFVNDRADLALAAHCDLHLAETSIPTALARALLPPERLIGRSTHAIEGALQAAREGADFVTFGPVYDTPSKRSFGPPQGIALLRTVCSSLSLPVFALGGVTLERIPECIEAGAHGVAMIGAVWDGPDPAAALLRCLDVLAET